MEYAKYGDISMEYAKYGDISMEYAKYGDISMEYAKYGDITPHKTGLDRQRTSDGQRTNTGQMDGQTTGMWQIPNPNPAKSNTEIQNLPVLKIRLCRI